MTSCLDGRSSRASFLDHACTATRMLEKRRLLFEVQRALEAEKEDFARKCNVFQKREEILREKDLRLQESLIKFNKVLQENESKRTRAIKRCADERRQCEEKENEATELKRILEEKAEEETIIVKELAKNVKYRDCLSQVVDSAHYKSETFAQIQDILRRYSTLKKINEELRERQQKSAAEIDDTRNALAHLMSDRGNTMLNRSNEVVSLQKQLETCKIATQKAQNLVESNARDVASRTSNLGQILTSISNIRERFENQPHRRKKAMASAAGPRDETSNHDVNTGSDGSDGSDAMKNIEKIADYMVDYKSIIEEWQQNTDPKVQGDE